MIEKLLRRLRLRNSIDFSLRSLISRPWFLLAHWILLSLCMSSFYIMVKLILIIPSRSLRGFEFFRRGGLEGSTDLLIFASGALLFSLLLTAVITLRMQIRLSWRANQENYLVLMQIGMSKAELKHALRLEGLIVLSTGLIPALLMSKLLLGILAARWGLEELNAALSTLNLSAVAISLCISIVLLEFAHINLVHTLDSKKVDVQSAKLPLYRRFRPKAEKRVQVWFEIKNHAWRISRFSVLADILTLSVSFALVFFIYATKAGINRPPVDRVANDVIYDLNAESGSLSDLKTGVERLLTDLPDALQGKIDIIYLNERATIKLLVERSDVKSHYRDLLEEAGTWPDKEENNPAIELDFMLYPLSRQNYHDFFELDPDKKTITQLSYDEWAELSAAILINEIDFAEKNRILSDDFIPFDLEEGSSLDLNDAKDSFELIYVSHITDLRPWFVDPVTDRLAPALLIPEEMYQEQIDPRQGNNWRARVRVDENSLISFHSVVKREWTWRQTDLRVTDHYGRRMEQQRIHHSLDILFNLSLFFIIQFVLILLIAFTQGQYFTREYELKLLREIGLSRKQERSMIRYHCIQIFMMALISSYLLAYTVAYIWNYYMQVITGMRITWPVPALIFFSLGSILAVLIFSQIRFKKNSSP